MARIGKGKMSRFSIYNALFLALLGMFLIGAQVQAAEVSAGLSSDQVTLDGQVTLSITIVGGRDVNDPELPQIAGFNIYTAGKTFSSSTVNGQTSTSVEYRYILVPQKPGQFVIKPIKVKVDGREYETDEMTLIVERGSMTPQTQSPGASALQNSTSKGEYIIESDINKDTVYEGEQLVYGFKAYQKRGAGFMSDPVYVPPSYSGFWKEEFGWKRYSRAVKGTPYVVSQLDVYLFPVSPGEVTIEPTKVVVTPDAFSNLFNFDPFNQRGLNTRGLRGMRPETLMTRPQIIDVLPLPREGRPHDFKGSVGQYKMAVDISSTQVTVDETILLKIKFSGQGNIKTIAAPDVPDIEGLDIRPSGDTSIVAEVGGIIQGSKTFEFSIIPDQEGVYDIPPLRWSYFDPELKNYKTLTSPEYSINIKPSGENPGDALSGLMTLPGDIKVRDILGAMPLKSDLRRPGKPLIMNPLFISLQALPLILLASVIVIRRRQEKLMGDVRLRRLKRAHGFAKKRLASASDLLNKNQLDNFYGEISKAIYQYVGDKFNLASSGLTESKVVQLLRSKDFSDDTIASFEELIRNADFGRFAPGQSGNDSAGSLLKEAEEWIIMAENEGKRTK